MTFIPPTGVIKGILPLVLIAWALAMTVFRSPVRQISTICLFTRFMQSDSPYQCASCVSSMS